MSQPALAQEFQDIPIGNICHDEVFQMRVSMDDDHVANLAALLVDDQELPAPTVFVTSADAYLLADGFHTVAAHIQNGASSILCHVIWGERLDAIRYAAQANHSHGLPRTKGDLANAFKTLVAETGLNPKDNAETRKLLRCSQRRADQLTKEYRDAHRQRQQTRAQELSIEGLSRPQIAQQVSVETGKAFSVDQVRGVERHDDLGFQHNAKSPDSSEFNVEASRPLVSNEQVNSSTPTETPRKRQGIGDSVVAHTSLSDEFRSLVGQFRDLVIDVAQYPATQSNIQTIAQGIALVRTLERD